MRLMFTVFEFIACLIPLSLGFYTFYSGFADSMGGSIVKLPIGAALIFGGGFALYASIRSRIRHRRRLRGISIQSAN
jgi:hypothetical protein